MGGGSLLIPSMDRTTGPIHTLPLANFGILSITSCCCYCLRTNLEPAPLALLSLSLVRNRYLVPDCSLLMCCGCCWVLRLRFGPSFDMAFVFYFSHCPLSLRTVFSVHSNVSTLLFFLASFGFIDSFALTVDDPVGLVGVDDGLSLMIIASNDNARVSKSCGITLTWLSFSSFFCFFLSFWPGGSVGSFPVSSVLTHLPFPTLLRPTLSFFFLMRGLTFSTE